VPLPHRVADLGPAARGVFTTAHGGVSDPPWPAAVPAPSDDADRGGLNLGTHVGDRPGSVVENRLRVSSLVGSPIGWMTQVHGDGVRVADAAAIDEAGDSLGEYDAVVVVRDDDRPVSAAVMVADCVPVLLADVAGAAAAAVHVGRGGLMADVLGETLAVLAGLGVPPERLVAHVGPSICPSCYEVPAAMRADVVAAHPAAEGTTADGTPALDLGSGVGARLEAAGVARVRREAACTYERTDLYSYRRATHAGDGRTGRFAGVVTIGGAVGASRRGDGSDADTVRT
jgi:YfiH family protein